jgi:ABC-type taurine transport system ATPase subunit
MPRSALLRLEARWMGKMRPVFIILVVSLAASGCGKKRILAEAGAITVLANDSSDLAREIQQASADPAVVVRASQIVDNQNEIVKRAHKVTLATVDVEDRSDDITAWWGDMFMGTIENVKWLAIAGGLAVIGFIGYRARVWTLIGKFLSRG